MSGASLKSALPERLGDAGEQGFTTWRGGAGREGGDRVYGSDGGAVRLEEAKPDIRRQKSQWKLVFSQNVPPAPLAPPYSADAGEEKNIIEKLPETSNGFFHSSHERTAKGGARSAGGAESDYESEEREAIQNEGEEKPCQDQD
jgi:hypothetical protein